MSIHPVSENPFDLPEVEWLSAAAAQKQYGANTIQVNRLLSGAFKVSEQSQVASILQWANEQGAALHPISSGRNWGYGSATPTSDCNPIYILDLSGLKRILEFDEELGFITLEPGVTQGELADWLKERGHDFMVPVTGAGPHCSLVGNALERGYGITPYSDHFAAVTALKAFLADGSRYQSSLCELDGSAEQISDKSFKWKVGPYLDGLFTQSNLGVVTEMTFRLAPRPQAFESFYVQFSSDDDLEKAVELMQGILRDYEGIVGSINLMDRRRILAMVADNPNGPEVHQAMTDEQCEALAKRYTTPAWMLVGSIYGMPGVVKAAKKDIARRVKPYAMRTLFSHGALLNTARAVCRILPKSVLKEPRAQLEMLEEGIEIMVGKPNQVALPLAYWRTLRSKAEKNKELNPAADGCGLMWYAPLVPTKAKHVREFVKMVRRICVPFGIEPLITLTSLRYDLIDSTVPILFNCNDVKAVQLAKECLNALVQEGLAKGYVPYRMNIEQQGSLLNEESTCWQLVKKLKQAMDPNQVITPGRYQPDVQLSKPARRVSTRHQAELNCPQV